MIYIDGIPGESGMDLIQIQTLKIKYKGKENKIHRINVCNKQLPRPVIGYQLEVMTPIDPHQKVYQTTIAS